MCPNPEDIRSFPRIRERWLDYHQGQIKISRHNQTTEKYPKKKIIKTRSSPKPQEDVRCSSVDIELLMRNRITAKRCKSDYERKMSNDDSNACMYQIIFERRNIKKKMLTSLSRSWRAFLLPIFDNPRFPSSSFNSTTFISEMGRPPMDGSLSSHIYILQLLDI